MKKFNNIYIIGVAVLSLMFGATSCTDYLDKSPDSDVSPETAFKNFTNFQGFVEEIYNCIPNKESNMWCCNSTMMHEAAITLIIQQYRCVYLENLRSNQNRL